MKDRLIETIQTSVGGCARHWAELIDDAIITDGWMRPPCKVGDTVYCVENNQITECVVRNITLDPKGLECLRISPKHKYTRCTFIHSKNLENLDRIKFTKEEAEKALQGVKG